MRTKSWQIDLQADSFRRFVSLRHYASVPAIIDWAFGKRHFLEEGFLYFEPQDPVFAAEILDALYLLENNSL